MRLYVYLNRYTQIRGSPGGQMGLIEIEIETVNPYRM